jgi:hypothetical protein
MRTRKDGTCGHIVIPDQEEDASCLFVRVDQGETFVCAFVLVFLKNSIVIISIKYIDLNRAILKVFQQTDPSEQTEISHRTLP